MVILITFGDLSIPNANHYRLFLYFLPWSGLHFSILYPEQLAIRLWMRVLTHITMQSDVCASNTLPEDKVITPTAHLPMSVAYTAAFLLIGLYIVWLTAGTLASVANVPTDFCTT